MSFGLRKTAARSSETGFPERQPPGETSGGDSVQMPREADPDASRVLPLRSVPSSRIIAKTSRERKNVAPLRKRVSRCVATSRLTIAHHVLILFYMSSDPEGAGQSHMLGLLEKLRADCNALWGSSSVAYHRVDELLRELANPNLHDIPRNLPFRVEMWDRTDPAHPLGRCRVGKCRYRARGARRRHHELSRPVVHVTERQS